MGGPQIKYIKNVLELLRKSPDVILKKYNPGQLKTAIKRQVARDLSMEPEKHKQYLAWRLKGTPQEVIEMLKEELARQQETPHD